MISDTLASFRDLPHNPMGCAGLEIDRWPLDASAETERCGVRITVSGVGLFASGLVTRLGARGFKAQAPPPNSAINTVTGHAPADCPKGATVVVDVSSSPSSKDAEVLEFFETSVAYFGDVEHSFRLIPNDGAERRLPTD